MLPLECVKNFGVCDFTCKKQLQIFKYKLAVVDYVIRENTFISMFDCLESVVV
jgi:hypothetical protein